jgi:thymidine kinase
MKSGKSYDLISFFAPLQYSTIPFSLYQSARNVRDEQIYSRNGVGLKAQKIASFKELFPVSTHIIGIDEVHMFNPDEVIFLEQLLDEKVKLIISGLDLDYQGKMHETVRRLLELGPKEVRYRRSICEKCKNPEATYSQVLQHNIPVVEGMPPVIPDDGTFSYQATCRKCFVRK